MKEVFLAPQRKIKPAAQNDGRILTESQVDLTRCPFSLNHYAMAYYGRGRSLEKQNMRSKAVQDYRKALEHDPNHRSARKALERLGVDP